MVDYTLRRLTTDDYEALADFLNRSYAPVPVNAEQIRESDVRRATYKIARWVAERNHDILGVGIYEQLTHIYDPTAVHVMVVVHPDERRQGIGQMLYRHVEGAAIAEGIRKIRTVAREEEPSSLPFAAKMGFTEEQRVFESALDLTTFDPTPFQGVWETLQAHGVTIRPYTDVKDDPTVQRRIYDMTLAISPDIPSAIAYTLPTFEQYQHIFENPKVPHEGFLLAFAGEELAGFTFHRATNEHHMNIDGSGVRREHRGKGIALALKVAGAQFARDYGMRTLHTTNDATNPAILALNRKLGFVMRPATVMMKKEVGEERKG